MEIFFCKFSLLSPVTLVTTLLELPPHLDLKSGCNPSMAEHVSFGSFSCLPSCSEADLQKALLNVIKLNLEYFQLHVHTKIALNP